MSFKRLRANVSGEYTPAGDTLESHPPRGHVRFSGIDSYDDDGDDNDHGTGEVGEKRGYQQLDDQFIHLESDGSPRYLTKVARHTKKVDHPVDVIVEKYFKSKFAASALASVEPMGSSSLPKLHKDLSILPTLEDSGMLLAWENFTFFPNYKRFLFYGAKSLDIALLCETSSSLRSQGVDCSWVLHMHGGKNHCESTNIYPSIRAAQDRPFLRGSFAELLCNMEKQTPYPRDITSSSSSSSCDDDDGVKKISEDNIFLKRISGKSAHMRPVVLKYQVFSIEDGDYFCDKKQKTIELHDQTSLKFHSFLCQTIDMIFSRNSHFIHPLFPLRAQSQGQVSDSKALESSSSSSSSSMDMDEIEMFVVDRKDSLRRNAHCDRQLHICSPPLTHLDGSILPDLLEWIQYKSKKSPKCMIDMQAGRLRFRVGIPIRPFKAAKPKTKVESEL